MFNIKKIFNHSKKNTKKRKRMSKAEKELDYITRLVALNTMDISTYDKIFQEKA